MADTNFDSVVTPAGAVKPYALQVHHFYLAGGQSTGAKKFAALIAVIGQIVDVRARLDTAPVGATFILDVNINGTTAFSTQGNRPIIADGANVSSTTLPNVVALAVGDRLSVDVDQVGSGTAGSDLYVSITIKRLTTN